MVTAQVNERLLEGKLEALEKGRHWIPRVISRLETLIRTADDYELFRINPIRYASDTGITENEAIDLFLHGTKQGLFEMEWHLLCTCCGCIVDSFRTLTGFHADFICKACCAEQTTTLDDLIQVSFTISPQIRDIVFHHPQALSQADFLKYRIAKEGHPDESTQTLVDYYAAYTLLIGQLAPQGKQTTEFQPVPGIVCMVDFDHNSQVFFFVMDNQNGDPQIVSARLVEGKLQVADRDVPLQTAFDGAFTHKWRMGGLSKGRVSLEIENGMDVQSTVWVFYQPIDKTGHPVFSPYLSGKRLLTTQTFRDLFRSEVIAADEGIAVKDLTYLFTDLKGSTALYDQIGDAKAYYLVRQHFDTLTRVISNHSGAIVKTIGDAVMATFIDPVDAVQAATDMLHEIEQFNRSISQDLILKIGIHRGHSIAVTLNDRLDYFGQSVNIAARVQALADADEIYISQDIYDSPGVRDLVASFQVTPQKTNVKGVSNILEVYRIAINHE